MQGGNIADVGLVVSEKEPKLDPALMRMKNVIVVPRMESASRETRLRMAKMATENVVVGPKRLRFPPRECQKVFFPGRGESEPA